MNGSQNKLCRMAFSKITVLSMTALLVAALVVSVANDLYAFVKPDREVSFSIEEPTPLNELAKALEEQGVIANPTVFRLWVQSKGKGEALEEFCGTLPLNSAMSYREILASFSQ